MTEQILVWITNSAGELQCNQTLVTLQLDLDLGQHIKKEIYQGGFKQTT